MEINLIEIWAHMGMPVRAVVAVLTLQAVACVAVTVDRLLMLAISSRKSREFAAAATPLLERGDYQGALAVAERSAGSHLAMHMWAGLNTFLERRAAGSSRKRAAALASRSLQRKGETISSQLNKGMNILASTGSTAPFVGLLGTVLGILNAFKMIAASGSGGIGTIGGAIGEALIVTGYGLTVAIPAVLVFNWLAGRITHFESGLLNAGGELIDRLESGALGELATSPGEAEAASSAVAAVA